MSTQVTQWIVWNERENKHEAGPFDVQADANAALRRVNARTGQDTGKAFSVQQVAATKQK